MSPATAGSRSTLRCGIPQLAPWAALCRPYRGWSPNHVDYAHPIAFAMGYVIPPGGLENFKG